MLKKTKTITNTSNDEVGFLETPFLQNRHTDMLIVLYLSVLQMFLLLQKFSRVFAFKCKVNFKLHLFSAQPF